MRTNAISTSRLMATTARVVLFWAIAALLVIWIDRGVSPRSPAGGAMLKVVVMLAVALAYMRIVEPRATLDHALFVGVTWLVLAVSAEIVIGFESRQGWYELLGSPDSALRNVVMIAWLAAPALCVRGT